MEKQDPVELEAVMRKFFFVLIGNMEFISALVFRVPCLKTGKQVVE